VAVADRDTSGIKADVQLPGDLTDVAYADGLPGAALGGLDMLFNRPRRQKASAPTPWRLAGSTQT
jgi:hypothetical protein